MLYIVQYYIVELNNPLKIQKISCILLLIGICNFNIETHFTNAIQEKTVASTFFFKKAASNDASRKFLLWFQSIFKIVILPLVNGTVEAPAF